MVLKPRLSLERGGGSGFWMHVLGHGKFSVPHVGYQYWTIW